jgi:hypothetical protein
MDKVIKVEINLEGLPEAPNHHKFAVALEERIIAAVELAMVDAFEDGLNGKNQTVHVPSF